MDFQELRYEIADHILTITLDRPDRLNAFTATMGRELIEAFDLADADDDVRAVIVTGAGRGFCAGADLQAGGSTFDLGDRRTGDDDVPRDGGGQVSLRIFDSTKPVIAAINGAAVGVGVTMTLPMDVRLAAEEARFGFVFVRRGIVPEACSSWFLPRIVGISRAMEWAATGRLIGAHEAAEAGLVRSVHPAADLLAAARELAGEVAEHAAPCRWQSPGASCGGCWARAIRWRRTAPTRGRCSPAAAPPTHARASRHSSRSARRSSPTG